MSRRDKLIRRLLKGPKDVTYDELSALLGILGYEEIRTGKTSGSRVAFISANKQHIIRLHKPHPGNVLRIYQVDYDIQELRKENLL